MHIHSFGNGCACVGVTGAQTHVRTHPNTHTHAHNLKTTRVGDESFIVPEIFVVGSWRPFLTPGDEATFLCEVELTCQIQH